jgi:DNA-binding response OmpR family regulator
VDAVYDGESGLDWARSGIYDVIVLDIMLPKLDGFEIVRRLREAKDDTPILLLTARGETTFKVKGLDCGADDYMTKPFSPDEFLARIRALSRRHGEIILNDLGFADLTLNLSTLTLSCGSRSVRLGPKEFEVLRLLMSSPGIIVTKEDLLLKIWGTESGAEDNNVEAYISFLRKKFFYLGSSVIVSTVRKVGYLLETDKV